MEPPLRCYVGKELYGYCMVIVWLLCGADRELSGFFDKLVERNIESPTRKAREILLIF